MGVFYFKDMEFKYWVLLIFLGALWGSAFMFIKVATPEYGPVALVNARLIIASLIYLPILLRKKYLPLLNPIWKHVLRPSAQPFAIGLS